jgi:hypothetical protein
VEKVENNQRHPSAKKANNPTTTTEPTTQTQQGITHDNPRQDRRKSR